MKFKRKIFLEKGHLDIAPLIDVIFLLLIFFMLTSSFVFQPGIKIDLPKAVTGDVLFEKSLVVYLTKGNEIFLNDRRIDLEELRSRLRIAAKEEKSLLIKADETVPLGQVVLVWDLCREEGVGQINIATNQSLKQR